jgi:hypothetical protein
MLGVDSLGSTCTIIMRAEERWLSDSIYSRKSVSYMLCRQGFQGYVK